MTDITEYRNLYLRKLKVTLRPVNTKQLTEYLEIGRKLGWEPQDLAAAINEQDFSWNGRPKVENALFALGELVNQVPPDKSPQIPNWEYVRKPEKLTVDQLAERFDLLRLAATDAITPEQAEQSMMELLQRQGTGK